MKEKYELLYIIPAKYGVEDLEPVYQKVRDVLTEYSAEILKEELFKKQRLAYPIQHIHQGIYMLIEFECENQNISKLEENLKHTPEILRAMITKVLHKSEVELRREDAYHERVQKEREASLAAVREVVKETPVKVQVEKVGPLFEEPVVLKPKEENESKDIEEKCVITESLNNKESDFKVVAKKEKIIEVEIPKKKIEFTDGGFIPREDEKIIDESKKEEKFEIKEDVVDDKNIKEDQSAKEEGVTEQSDKNLDSKKMDENEDKKDDNQFKPEKIRLEDLDKKLDEILDDSIL